MGAIEFEAKLKRLGRSFGIVVPMSGIKDGKISENESLEVIITKKKNPLRETFGTVKLKRSTKEILDESDREDWDE